jgi:hypothetical protein
MRMLVTQSSLRHASAQAIGPLPKRPGQAGVVAEIGQGKCQEKLLG